MFSVHNFRTDSIINMSSSQLKDFIIKTTNSKFENSAVLPERTGLRPAPLRDFILSLEEFEKFKNIYLVTTLSRVNKDPNTRYLLISVNNDVSIVKNILPYINTNISFIHVNTLDNEDTHEGGFFSSWFRNNMGRAFSFIDIDYLLLNPNRVFLVEEKTHFAPLGYGQKMSYYELLSDIFNVESRLLLVQDYSKDELYMKIFKATDISVPQKVQVYKKEEIREILYKISKK